MPPSTSLISKDADFMFWRNEQKIAEKISLPIRRELIAALKEWVDLHEITGNQRIFGYTRRSIHRALLTDLKHAGIPQVSEDG